MKIQNNQLYRNFNRKENKVIDLEMNFKKILSIIFQFHKNKKTIVFLGLPNKCFTKQHIFLPEFYWVRGLLTNKRAIYKYIQKTLNHNNKNTLKQYFFLKKTPDLFVIYNAKPDNDLLKEAFKLKIPVIFLGNQYISTHKISYQLHLRQKTIRFNKYLINLLHLICSK